MIDVIQVYKFQGVFKKPFYTPENRKQFSELKPEIASSCGYLDEQMLVLPRAYKDLPGLPSANLIILLDIDANTPIFDDEKHVFGFKNPNSKIAFEIFKLCKTSPECFDVFLDYTTNAARIGIPKRENHKIGELKISRPIRYKINGKSDFTFSGRKQRTFYEFEYILDWIGCAEEINFQELNQIKRSKKLPLTTCKLIEERKILR